MTQNHCQASRGLREAAAEPQGRPLGRYRNDDSTRGVIEKFARLVGPTMTEPRGQRRAVVPPKLALLTPALAPVAARVGAMRQLRVRRRHLLTYGHRHSALEGLARADMLRSSPRRAL